MATDIQPRTDLAAFTAEAKPCETTKGCDFEATYMVWCDHHQQGCDYTGYRCDIHLNLLVQETMRQIKAIEQGWLSLCDTCGAVVESGVLPDHLRWARL